MFLILYTLILSLTSQATSLNQEYCKYNGKILDTSKSQTELGDKFITKVDEKFTGKKECFHSNGKLDQLVPFEKGVIQGLMKDFDEKGNLEEEANMKNGVRDGLFKRYDYNTHKLIQEWNYKNGEFIGVARNYNSETGKLENIRMIQPDLNGSELYYNSKGLLSQLNCGVHPLPEDTELCGRKGLSKKISLYHVDSDKVKQTYFNKNGKREGEDLQFNLKGEVVSKRIYKNGEVKFEEFNNPKGKYVREVDGSLTTETSYFPSGKLKSIIKKNGRQTISEKEFYENTSKKLEVEKKSDVYNVSTFYDNNQLECKFISEGPSYYGSYGQYQGPRTCYFENGKLSLEENYKNNRLEGEQKYYDRESYHLARKENYINNLIVESWTYDIDGKVISNDEYESDGSRKL